MTLLDNEEDQKAEQIKEKSFLSNQDSKVAIKTYRNKSPSTIEEETGINSSNLSNYRKIIQDKKTKAEKTLNTINQPETINDIDTALEETFLGQKELQVLKADHTRTYIEDNQEKLKQRYQETDGDLEINTIDEIQEKTEFPKDRISIHKSNIKNKKEKAENTIKIAEQVQEARQQRQ